jgi:putative addiction module component (TIGR02574 family)
MRFAAIEKVVLELSTEERARLAQRLLESLDEVSEAEAEQLWLEVAARRAEEIDQGKVQLVSEDELERRVQALLK